MEQQGQSRSPWVEWCVDSNLTHGMQKGRYAPTNKDIKDRARTARRWLKARPEKAIVVVTHGGFLHYFTEDWEDSTAYQGMYLGHWVL